MRLAFTPANAWTQSRRKGWRVNAIFGCVTTGEAWQFLKLEGSTLQMDNRRYYIDRVDMILGMLQAIVASYQAATA